MSNQIPVKATNGVIRHLKRQIESNMVQSESGHLFLPGKMLLSIFNIENIEEAVKEIQLAPPDRLGLAHYILDSAIRIFAILIKCGEEHSINVFRLHDIIDSQLPLAKESLVQKLGDFGSQFTSEYQWQFLPFIFRKNMSTRRTYIDSKRILPFLPSHSPMMQGGFGDVSRVQIYSSLQDFIHTTTEHVYVVRKKLRIREAESQSEYDQRFSNEQLVSTLLSQIGHRNILPSFASYTHGNEHFFLFPAADMDLRALLKSQPPFGQFKHTVTFYSALTGLASALCHLHKFHLEKQEHGIDYDAVGYHHDVRPANILVDSETFMLADFGLGRLKPNSSQSHTLWKVGVGDYIAPECMDENFQLQTVGRGVDVWAFGCLIVELAVYMKEGPSGLESFRQARFSTRQWSDSYFFDTETRSVKPLVQENLIRLTEGTFYASRFAALGRLAGKALTFNVRDRPGIGELHNDLKFISLKYHFYDICSLFDRRSEWLRGLENSSSSTIVKIWFERERYKALGHLLGLRSEPQSRSISHELSHTYEYVQKVMTKIFNLFQDGPTDERLGEGEKDVSAQKIQILGFERQVQDGISSIWNHLPDRAQRKGETIWARAVLDDDETMGIVDLMDRPFNSNVDFLYDKIAALAMMKRLRLEMEQNAKSFPKRLKLSQNDIEIGKSVRGHTFGLFKKDVPVLVEWMYYTKAWKAIPPAERMIVMGLRAQGFDEVTKPQDLSTLYCLGVFEDQNEGGGFGFVYKLPKLQNELQPDRSVRTLLQLLEHPQTLDAPSLQERFRLAYVLADFLNNFHCIGWLHKDFTSDNILFFKAPPRDGFGEPEWSDILEVPYIAGLNNSRPDGQNWHTEGTSIGRKLQEYQHPDYMSTRRYRMEYDYYSFGLILLEVGFWRPLSHWTEKYKTLGAAEFRNMLLTQYVPRLGAKMGAIYQKVTRYCLTIHRKDTMKGATSSEAERDWEDKGKLTLILENVIEPLGDLSRIKI